MPKNKVTDPITDQEMAFAHLVLSGTMTDRRAAEAVGLNPESASYIKCKPRVRTYMAEHRAAVEEKLVDQEAENLRKLNITRDKILERLWELAHLSHTETRGNINGQIKALSMIASITGLIAPARGAKPKPKPEPESESLEPPYEIYESAWHREIREQQAHKQEANEAGEEPANAESDAETQPTTQKAAPAPPPEPTPVAPAPPQPPALRVPRYMQWVPGSLR